MNEESADFLIGLPCYPQWDPESVHMILAACVRRLLRDQTLWWNISAKSDLSTNKKPAAGCVWLARRCRKMLTFTLRVAALRAVLIFQTPLLFKDQRSITVSHVGNGTEEGKLLFTRKEKLILPREAGLSIKSVPFWTPRRPDSDW